MIKKTCVLFIYFLFLTSLLAKSPIFSDDTKPPPRIIRTCCSFGYDVKVFLLPGIKVTDISAPNLLGKHEYLGSPEENNGIIYTKKGGFIDLGHLRDQADWTAYLFHKLKNKIGEGQQNLKLGKEAGEKILHYNIPQGMSDTDIVEIAGRIAYDLSVWHEIATMYGASTIPFVPERYSGFSVEDAYSNLLGTILGIRAINSDLPFEDAMTELIKEELEKLEAVNSVEETRQAMDAADGIWWNKEKRLPSRHVLINRKSEVYGVISPELVLSEIPFSYKTIEVVEKVGGLNIHDFYTLNIHTNLKIPFRKIFLEREEKGRIIGNSDFQELIAAAMLNKKFELTSKK